MKEYALLFRRRETAAENQKNCMTFNHWRDIEQARESARLFLGMMQSDYARVDIYIQKGTMWVDSGEFVEWTEV